MSKSKQQKAKTLTVVQPHAAGIDIGSREHWVCVGDDAETDVRMFGTFTCDLQALADWLAERGVKTVAMESTGVYWIPLYELLESRGLEVMLVDPRQTKQHRGRPKTDKHDCQWIRRLHSFGLLTGAFRPGDAICVLRGYLRRRLTLTEDAGRYIQQMQKALEQMNVKLSLVVSDITGVTGLRILKSILRGVRDPVQLAKHRDRRCKNDEETIAKGLQGNWREEHLFALRQGLAAWEFCQKQLGECDGELQRYLRQLVPADAKAVPPKPRQRGRRPNDVRFDARTMVAQIAGVDLTAIEGIDESTAMVILSEIGIDASKWPTEKHFASWLGVAPNPKKSGKYLRKSRTKPTQNRVARALRLAAQTLHHSKSALGAFFRRLRARLGAPKAITATAHKLARLVWRMLKHGTEYVAQGVADYEAKFQSRMLKSLRRRAADFGFALVSLT